MHWRMVPLIFFILLIYFLWKGLALNPQELPSSQVNKPLPIFALPALQNDKQFTSNLMQGKFSLLNVWASWCDVCAQEQIFLLQLAQQGIVIYGLNYKDNSEKAKTWLAEWGNPYKMVGLDENGKVAIDLGVYRTPETFLIDKNGIIRYRHLGVLDAEIWHDEFLPRIKQLEAA